MQGKGIVRFFLIVLTIVSLIQYFFYFPTRGVEKDAERYATELTGATEGDVFRTAYAGYLDSMNTETVFSIPLVKDYTYQELKGQQLALGLDLKGGMSSVLQVDLKEFIQALSNNSNDETFRAALEKADADQRNSQADFVSLFLNAWQELANGKKLAPIFALNESLREDINFETTDGQVAGIIREKADEAVDLTFKLLKERIDKLGVAQPNISLDAARDLITVELPGIDNPERARSLITKQAQLEFWQTYWLQDQGVQQALIAANDRLRKTEGGATTKEVLSIEQDTSYVIDADGNTTDEILEIKPDTTFAENIGSGPLFDRMTLGGGSRATLGLVAKNERKTVMEFLNREDIKNLFPRDLEFRWSKDPLVDDFSEEGTGEELGYELYGVKIPRGGNGQAPLGGDHVVDASAQPDPTTGEMAVSLNMDQTGAKTWAKMTKEAFDGGGRQIAIVLDDEVVSAPGVNNGAITGGRSSISGNFSTQEAGDLANVLEVGKLPTKVKSIQESLIGPSLGAENIRRSIMSLVIGFALVLVFMMLYYGGGGIVSIIALFLNLFFIFGALASIGTVLTLPGIAGIILTIGMAVDANVIIYERIREELRDGKSLRLAVNDGFQNSYSAIIDANVTTILTAIILAYFGLGPIKGFAVILIIGVLSSLFTAVLVGRLLIDWWLSKDRDMSFSTGFSKDAFANLNIDWLGKRKIAYGISLGIILLGLVSMFTRGFDLGVDFKGGYSYNIQFDEGVDVSAEGLRTTLTDVFGSTPTVKAVDIANTFNVVTDYLVDETGDDVANRVMAKLHEGINAAAGGNIALDNFSSPEGTGTHVTSSTKVGPIIADDIRTSAFYASIFALLAIFLYIFIRFSKPAYSVGAVAALFHDVLVVLAIFSLGHSILPFSLEVDQAFIAAVLTVIGYSINDTVVVFDRIREFMNTYTNRTKEEVINMAVNSTVSRTVITSLTTFLVVFILFLFGGTSIKGFAFALLVGILVGTYSSVFVATPIMSDLIGDLKPKKVEKKSFSRAAERAQRGA